jgi:hypothetical protein
MKKHKIISFTIKIYAIFFFIGLLIISIRKHYYGHKYRHYHGLYYLDEIFLNYLNKYIGFSRSSGRFFECINYIVDMLSLPLFALTECVYIPFYIIDVPSGLKFLELPQIGLMKKLIEAYEESSKSALAMTQALQSDIEQRQLAMDELIEAYEESFELLEAMTQDIKSDSKQLQSLLDKYS